MSATGGSARPMARPGHAERAGLCKFAWFDYLALLYTTEMPWFRCSCQFRCGSARILRVRRTPLRPSGAPLLLGCGPCHTGIELVHAQAFDARGCGERRVRCQRKGVFAPGDGRGRLRQKLRHLAVLCVQDRLLGGRASSGTACSTFGRDPARVGARERTQRCAHHLRTSAPKLHRSYTRRPWPPERAAWRARMGRPYYAPLRQLGRPGRPRTRRPARLVRGTIARNHHSEGRGRTENGTTHG